MALSDRLRYVPDAATGLCRTCTWATLRKGFRPTEVEVFCRLLDPSARVPHPARECTGYCDGRATSPTSEARRFGFVTEIKLEDGSKVRLTSGKESASCRGEG
jgi:hypothetical protein